MFDVKSNYLNAAYLGPMPVQAKKNVEAVCARMLDPAFYPHSEWRGIPDKLREKLAGLLGGRADQVALSTSVSELMSHIADGADLKGGDEVVLMDGDYPSAVLPWMVRGERNGFTLKMLPVADFLDPRKLERAITPKTKVVASSHVMFNTGLKLPAADIAKICREKEILYIADVSQSFGGMPLPQDLVENAGAILGVCYKWLLGPYGSAFGYFSPWALSSLKRTHASWLQNPNSQNSENLLVYSTKSLPGARKYDRGETATYLIMAALRGSLDVIAEFGLNKIAQHNAGLVKHFLGNVPKKFELTAPEENRSNIICINQKGLDTSALKEKLAKENIDVSVREGSLRISFHIFNTKENVDHLLRCLN